MLRTCICIMLAIFWQDAFCQCNNSMPWRVLERMPDGFTPPPSEINQYKQESGSRHAWWKSTVKCAINPASLAVTDQVIVSNKFRQDPGSAKYWPINLCVSEMSLMDIKIHTTENGKCGSTFDIDNARQCIEDAIMKWWQVCRDDTINIVVNYDIDGSHCGSDQNWGKIAASYDSRLFPKDPKKPLEFMEAKTLIASRIFEDVSGKIVRKEFIPNIYTMENGDKIGTPSIIFNLSEKSRVFSTKCPCEEECEKNCTPFCFMILHEIGHVFGIYDFSEKCPQSQNNNNVMYGYSSGYVNPPGPKWPASNIEKLCNYSLRTDDKCAMCQLNCVQKCALLSVEKISPEQNNSILLFPNPTNADVRIYSKGLVIRKYILFDAIGRPVENMQYSEGAREIELQTVNLVPGTYLLYVFQKEIATVYKIIKY